MGLRMPQSFYRQLPKNWLSAWIRTKVTYAKTVYDVAVAFDVFRVIVAVQCGDSVDQVSVDHRFLRPFDTPEAVIARAVAYGFDNGFDESNEEATIDSLADGELILELV